MDCIYNTGGFCYKDQVNIRECQYAGDEAGCEDAVEG